MCEIKSYGYILFCGIYNKAKQCCGESYHCLYVGVYRQRGHVRPVPGGDPGVPGRHWGQADPATEQEAGRGSVTRARIHGNVQISVSILGPDPPVLSPQTVHLSL